MPGRSPGTSPMPVSRWSSFASRLEDRGIEGVVDDVARFARRRPGVFLLAAAGAGFVVGRFVRSGVSVARDPSPNGGRDGEVTRTSTTTTPTAQAEVLPPPSPLTTGMRVP